MWARSEKRTLGNEVSADYTLQSWCVSDERCVEEKMVRVSTEGKNLGALYFK